MSKTKVLKVYPNARSWQGPTSVMVYIGGETIGKGVSQRAAWANALETIEKEAACRRRFEQLPLFIQDFLRRHHEHLGRRIIYFEEDVISAIEHALKFGVQSKNNSDGK